MHKSRTQSRLQKGNNGLIPDIDFAPFLIQQAVINKFCMLTVKFLYSNTTSGNLENSVFSDINPLNLFSEAVPGPIVASATPSPAGQYVSQ